MKNWIKENKGNIVIFIIYIIISFGLIFFHEAWRDEAQAWLLARDLSFTELIAQMKYEGHFLLWYLILMPFAKMGFPYITTNIISCIITSVSAWLILKYAPFKNYKKYLFIFSFPMLYLFPIISRSYCLIPLAIVLIAIFYKERKEKPIRYVLSIVVLANTHIIMWGMVGILLLEFFIEVFNDKNRRKNRKNLQSFILAALLLILSIIPLLGGITTNKDIGYEATLGQKLFYMFIIQPFTMISAIYYTFKSDIAILAIIISLTIIFFFFEIINHRKEFLKILLIFLSQYAIYAFVYATSLQRASTGILIIFFYRWIRAYKPQKEIKKFDKMITDITLIILLVINIIGGIIYIWEEVNSNYSSAHEVGEYINNSIANESIMVTGGRTEFCSAIVPYVSPNIKFYHIQENKYFTYTIWNEENKKIIETDFIQQLREKFNKNEQLYYIYNLNETSLINDQKIVKEMEERKKLIKVFETSEDFGAQETYIVYKINLNN